MSLLLGIIIFFYLFSLMSKVIFCETYGTNCVHNSFKSRESRINNLVVTLRYKYIRDTTFSKQYPRIIYFGVFMQK